jgi:hypothetical protein
MYTFCFWTFFQYGTCLTRQKEEMRHALVQCNVSVVGNIWRLFAKSVDSPFTPSKNFVEVQLTVSFSKHFPWQVTHFLQHSTHFLKTNIDYFEISCLRAPCSWLEKPRNCMGQYLDCMPNTKFNSYLTPCNFWAFQTMNRELWGKKFQSDQQSAACFWEVSGAL